MLSTYKIFLDMFPLFQTMSFMEKRLALYEDKLKEVSDQTSEMLLLEEKLNTYQNRQKEEDSKTFQKMKLMEQRIEELENKLKNTTLRDSAE